MKFHQTLLLLFCFFVGRAQDNINFKHLNVEDGLSQSSVLAIAQDSKGFLWFGTRFGLNKYDSRNFKIYKKELNEKSLSHSEYISTIFSAHDGTLWIGTPYGLNKYNEAKDNFDHILHKENDERSLSNSRINCIYQDKKGRLWVGTTNGLNLLTSKTDYYFKRFLYDKNQSQQVYAILEDSKGTIWLSTSKGLMSMTIKQGHAKIKYFKSFSDQINKAIDNHITCFAEDGENNLWIGTKQTGLNKFDLKTGNITNYTANSPNATTISSNNIRNITVDLKGKLWIGTLHGITVYDPRAKTFKIIVNEPGNNASLSQNSVYDIFQDKQGIIWIGTYYGGINMVYPDYTPFKIYNSSKTSTGLSSSVVSSITEDTDHNLWIGTEGEGLNYFDRKNNTYIHYRYNPKNPKSLSSNIVKSIIKDKQNRIWIGTHLGGLNLFDPATKTFTRYTSKKNDTSSISNDEITSIFEDSKGRFWVGTNNGLNSFNTSTGKFIRKRINGLSDAIFFIFEDSKYNIWVATNSGLYQLKNGAESFTSRKADDPAKLPYNDVSCIREDKSGFIWLGTFRNGLFKLDTKKHSYLQIKEANGLPSNNIVGILEDDQNNLWISTDKGLCAYHPIKQLYHIYNIKDGLPGNEFNYKSLLKDSKGEFFFGSLSGMISFFPNEIKENKSIPKALFTDLKLFNNVVKIDQDEKLLDSNISLTKSITFKSNQNVFSIDFTVLNFIKSDKNLYAYKLVGFEKTWNYVSIPTANYTNLSPGSYTLLVKGSNNDGLWTKNPTELKIKVLPPFYKTWWAYLIYLCFIAAMLFVIVRYLLIKAVLTKEKEINEHKLQFFTNISHEIRTPLTLIIGPLEKLIDKTKDDPQLNTELQPIKHNANRLMTLVTELLDFRKAESGKMELKVSPGNIVKFCQEIFLAFENVILAKNITYTFESEQDEIEVYFDKVQMEKVMFNLLSNAYKFCPENGKIGFRITEDKNQVHIKIRDDGKGIPKEVQENLFQDFYQAETSTNIGTGLGLSLSKSICELHHGYIQVDSELASNIRPGWACFIVSLKKGKAHFKTEDFIPDYIYYDDAANYKQEQITTYIPENIEPAAKPKAGKQFTVLIIEDNAEIRGFIKNSLLDFYNIQECENGQQGWEIAIELIPDLILSDVMMPEMDGLELCRKLKTDIRTSHIPVVLLTARSAYIHQINGLESGADAYIMKPFNLKILLLNIQNLLNLRETFKKKYAQVIKLEPKDLVINKTEQDFLTKVIQVIEENMADPDFGVPVLASEIGMSQSVLYKKIRAVTDLSVNDFIKSIRLKKAAQLLLQKIGNISEIAYSVGYNDRKYFSLEFKKQFGMSPSEFMQQDRHNHNGNLETTEKEGS
ncbi:hybrid sensor histidine kinase/response regulator transcription factor [Pedobacter gandavensis]|uniref:histidine kinase n=1 Tax=Pedobacter gandavensis TaxID=2679963 RepID=A0ABR6F1K0_9SPHI|nr:two-component regulator propeller domain-containing protein [Pedobacter gandavensis]MBB2151412.1 response regulator [Pedobacter gandavensis]